MSTEVEYQHNEERTILTRVYVGAVNKDDVIEAGNEIIKNKMISESHKGVISDMRDASLNYQKGDIKELFDFYSENINFFKDLKLAFIIDSTDIVYPMLFKIKHDISNIRYFVTLEAAMNWITS